MKRKPFAFVVLVVLSLVQGCSQPEYHMPASTTKTPEQRFIQEMAQKSGGDLKALSPAEVQRLNRITRGNAELALKAEARRLKK
ncbi:MAG: hypothetical protein SFX74_12885 [Fimbriimonadaceae bacterium]|nr:hypothetical protein [Fimbriimonadaceae bacterium]